MCVLTDVMRPRRNTSSAAWTRPPYQGPPEELLKKNFAANLSGNGDDVTPPLLFGKGRGKIRMRHSGSSKFEVRWYGEERGLRRRLARSSGPYVAEVSINVMLPGIYVLDVLADGPWSIDIEQ